jgi:glutathione S-transferase
MKIFGVGASRSFRAVWGACEAEVAFEYISLDFGSNEQGGTHSSEYKQINSQSKFPSLIDGDFVLTESGAILNYLAHQSKNKNLIPEDGTKERAVYEQMCLFVLTELEQPLWTTGKHRFAIPEEYRVPQIMEKTTAFEYEKAQDALLYLMGDRPFAAGEEFTMADVLLGQTLAWAYNFKFEVADSLLEYKDKLFAREACIKAKAMVKPEA